MSHNRAASLVSPKENTSSASAQDAQVKQQKPEEKPLFSSSVKTLFGSNKPTIQNAKKYYNEVDADSIKHEQAYAQLMTHVVRGEPKEAQLIVRKYPELALKPGSFIDLSGRKFVSVSPIAFVFHADDVDFCNMFLPFIDQFADGRAIALKQINETSLKDTNLKSYDFKPLIKAITDYVFTEQEYDLGEEFKADAALTAEAEEYYKLRNAAAGNEAEIARIEAIRDDKCSIRARDCNLALDSFRNDLRINLLDNAKLLDHDTIINAYALCYMYCAYNQKCLAHFLECYDLIIGYMQRFLVAHHAQAIIQGPFQIMGKGLPLVRNLTLNNGAFFYPEDLTLEEGLGFDYSVTPTISNPLLRNPAAVCYGANSLVRYIAYKASDLQQFLLKLEDPSVEEKQQSSVQNLRMGW